jgi:catechol 2,3-dioxygenase-like lactoylglutathione lyase family enzyme
MSKPAQSEVIIELHVPDFEKTKDFYGRLGFETVWERFPEGFKGYLVMKKRNNILCFWGGNKEIYKHPYFRDFAKETKRGYGVEIVIFVEEIEKYYEKVRKFSKIVEVLKEQPWGDKDFRVEDPFGFYLRFSSPYNTLLADKAVK